MQALNEHPGAFVCLSALLTTTMVNMDKINRLLKENHPEVKTFVGGIPVTPEFAAGINADYYTDGQQELAEIMNKITTQQ